MARGDRGSTLIEIMISVVLIGVLLAAILSAVQLSIKASSTAYSGAELETVLINASDRVSRAPQLCNYDQFVQAAALAENWPTSSMSVTVEKLIPKDGAVPASWTAQNCPSDVRAFDVQRVTITATNPGAQITRTLTIVKSDVN